MHINSELLGLVSSNANVLDFKTRFLFLQPRTLGRNWSLEDEALLSCQVFKGLAASRALPTRGLLLEALGTCLDAQLNDDSLVDAVNNASKKSKRQRRKGRIENIALVFLL